MKTLLIVSVMTTIIPVTVYAVMITETRRPKECMTHCDIRECNAENKKYAREFKADCLTGIGNRSMEAVVPKYQEWTDHKRRKRETKEQKSKVR